MSGKRTIKYTLYSYVNRKGEKKFEVTNNSIELLLEMVPTDMVDIIMIDPRKRLILKRYNLELRRSRMTQDELTSHLNRSNNLIKLNSQTSFKNGRAVGQLSAVSGRLKQMQRTKYLCPDNHVTNAVFYKYYCINHGLDPDKAIKLSI